MSAPITVGLVGCGGWGRHILRDLRLLGCEVTVVARSEASGRTAVEGGATRVVPDPGMLPDVAGIVVATPTSTHAGVIDALLDRGVPIFTEKPLTDDPRSACALAARAPDRLFVMDKWRYHPGVELLREIAGSGEFGPVLSLRTTRVGWGAPHVDADTVWHLAPHDLAIALEILGRIPEPRSAAADRDGETLTALIGILGEDPWVAIEVSERHAERRREVRLHCRDGVACLPDGYSPHVRITRPSSGSPEGQEDEVRPLSTELPLLRELRAFVEHLRGGPPPRSSAAEGARVVEVIDRLRRLAGASGARGDA